MVQRLHLAGLDDHWRNLQTKLKDFMMFDLFMTTDKINSITVRDLTRMDDILAFRMFSRGKKFFSVVDLKSM